MIIGDNREAVIDNIRTAAESGDFYAKVEVNDPVLSSQESLAITERFTAERKTLRYRMKASVARRIANLATALINRNTEIVIEGDFEIPRGAAVITSNHFSPLENTVIRHFVRKLGWKRLNIVSQVTNHAMTGFIGFLMNYADTIPIYQEPHYLSREFMDVLSQLTARDEVILVYPEQEMWFNYRKPRPIKRGAYSFAAKLGVPVISCFVEMVDLPEMDTEEFHKVKYILHVLDVLYPDPEKTVKENSSEMCERDYQLKKEAYERVYGRTLDYGFEACDIAGWTGSAHA